MTSEPFIYCFERGQADAARTLLLLHGTGGNENDLLPLGGDLDAGAHRLSPRGKVSERGAPRFFRRIAEGLLDIDDWRARSAELATFVRETCNKEGIPPAEVTALGYSNGANIALGLLLLHPDVIGGAILLRPMFITNDLPIFRTDGRRVLIVSGQHDPLMQPGDPERLLAQLKERGADATLAMLPTGHGLTSADVDLARDWLAQGQ